MKKSTFKGYSNLVVFIALAFFLVSWGSTGHYKISYNASFSFNQEMEQFQSWASILADHASDADIRKATDPTESYKHYIDIDNYGEFVSNGSIPQQLTDAVAAHGQSFVDDQGILPWATVSTFDSLKACFEREDWDQAVLFASDLGHYVADGHMPLHITRNYNGQYSGNYGIHSRYESTMINSYISQIAYSGEPISIIQDVNQYVFNYLYTNYVYVDSVIEADNFAQSFSSNTSSSLYKEALWQYSKDFTILLFKNASHALAELIYTAWVEAGSPSMAQFINEHTNNNDGIFLGSNYPNPFSSTTTVNYTLEISSPVSLSLLDCNGNTVQEIEKEKQSHGHYTRIIDTQNLSPGIYVLALKTETRSQFRKLVKVE